MMKEKYDVAKFMFNNALQIDATLFEALYNMGNVFSISNRSRVKNKFKMMNFFIFFPQHIHVQD